MELDSLYQEVILDHYKNPHHKGVPDVATKVHHVNPSCGDEIDLSLTLEGKRVTTVVWDGIGCSISQASASMMTDLVVGKISDDALELVQEFTVLMQSKGAEKGNEDRLEDAVALSGVSKFPARVKCALLGWMAFKDALTQHIAREDGESQ